MIPKRSQVQEAEVRIIPKVILRYLLLASTSPLNMRPRSPSAPRVPWTPQTQYIQNLGLPNLARKVQKASLHVYFR